jgi:hypothetical protein
MERFMDISAILGLPYIQSNQAQKHVTHNEAIRALDAVVQVGVIDRDLAAPPALNAEGDRYIVAAGASGDWAGHDHALALYADGYWSFYAPMAGWLAWVEDEALLAVWNGTTWNAVGSSGASRPIFGVNTSGDTTNRLSVKSDAVLISHDDVTPGSGDTRLTLNKAAAASTASVLFQNAFSGRAEYGLTGDDDWHVKVSPDGATWHEALVVDSATGNVGVAKAAPSCALDVAGPARVGQYTVAGLPSAAASGAGAIVFVSDESGGATLAVSDGTDWRRATDLAVVS